MALQDLSRTGKVSMSIKDPLPDSSGDGEPQNLMGFIPAERASMAVVAGATEVNPLSVDLPHTKLMSNLTEFSNINFNSVLEEPINIGSSRYMTPSIYGKKDASTGEYIPPGNYGETAKFEQEMTDIIDQTGKGEVYKKTIQEPYGEYRNRLKMLGPGEEDYFMDSVPAGQEPYDPNYFSSTEDFLSGIKSDNVLAGSDYMQGGSKFKRQNIPFTALGAGQMVYSSLMENHFVKGVKNNPEKYLGNPKYIKNAAGYFSKQGSKQFGSNFKEYPEAAIMVAEANQALYDYLQSTEAGRKRAVELGLNENAINEQTAKASSYKLEAQKRARSYSAFQDGEINSKEDVAAKKLAYASMSQKDLDNTDAAGSGQYEGMAIGGNKVYVDISDGMVSGTKFKSGTIFVKWKKEERERRAKEQENTKQENTKQENTKQESKDEERKDQKENQERQEQKERQEQEDNKAGSGSTGGYTGDTSGRGGSGNSDSSGSGSSGSGSSGSGYSGGYQSGRGRKLGGRVTFQEGGSVPMGNPMGNPMGQQQPLQDAGNLELVQEQGKDMSGVADDVPRELAEGDFVINAPAMEMAGRGDVEQMIKKAVTELQSKGVKLDFGQEAEDIDSTVQALVSNKEMIIPKIIAEQIGYDRLEKINNRGKKRVEEIEQEQGQQQVQQNPTQPNPLQGMMAVGGQVSLDENKNQPIAVPQESFAGQSSVGSKLLSPMSPEAQDDEKELTNRSQSFEGFMKPVKLASGDKVTQSFTKDEIDRLIFKESSGNANAEVNNEKEHSMGLMQVGNAALTDVNKMYKTNYKFNDLKDPNINKEVGTNYLNMLLDKYGNKEMALAAYNYGMTNVGKDTDNNVENFKNLPEIVQNYAKGILNIQVVNNKQKTNTINPSGMMGK